MLDVFLTYPTPEGSREIAIREGRLSIGRGSDADLQFADNGLSRLHATVYREGERIWIVDENSVNGTLVNGVTAAPAGTPLRNGDEVRIGNETALHVRFVESRIVQENTPVAAASTGPTVSAAPAFSAASLVPVVAIAAALMVISLSAVFIAFTVLGFGKNSNSSNENQQAELLDDTEPTPRSTRLDPTPSSRSSPDGMPPANSGAENITGTVTATPTPASTPSGKKYLAMTETEKRQYVSDRSMRIAQVIGNRSSDQIPPDAVEKIKGFTDAYAKRINVKSLGGCRFGDSLQATYERASKNAPFIIRAFNEKGIDPRIGLYLAMIESEHCVCLQSPTGPLGMFQFTKATGELHGLKTVKGASPTNPDERCEPEPSARAAASYMKALTGRFGTGPASVPLAIGSYNSGEGGLSSNLVKALESNSGLPRDFWTLISKGDLLSKQFQSENFKYVPKFFAAAIVGENPQDFGMSLLPISSYSK